MRWVRGKAPGSTYVHALLPRSSGNGLRDSAQVVVHTPGGLDPDSLVLTPGCARQILLRVKGPDGRDLLGQTAEFTVEDSSLVDLTVPVITGSYRGVSRMVSAKRVGGTKLIARWLDGDLTDTARVRVVPPVATELRSGLVPDSVGIGGYAAEGAYVYDQCEVALRDQPVVTYRNLNPEIIELQSSQARSGSPVAIRGLKPGTGRVEAMYGALRDTLRVEVLNIRLLPADTTVTVGSNVTYRAVRVDASGNETTVPLVGLSTYPYESPVASANDETRTVKALAPGTVELIGVADGPRHVGTRITVVPAPGN